MGDGHDYNAMGDGYDQNAMGDGHDHNAMGDGTTTMPREMVTTTMLGSSFPCCDDGDHDGPVHQALMQTMGAYAPSP